MQKPCSTQLLTVLTLSLLLAIMHPMDLQTMQKKVKTKQYKSKREFKDDLDLIWANCFTYNRAEVRTRSLRSLAVPIRTAVCIPFLPITTLLLSACSVT